MKTAKHPFLFARLASSAIMAPAASLVIAAGLVFSSESALAGRAVEAARLADSGPVRSVPMLLPTPRYGDSCVDPNGGACEDCDPEDGPDGESGEGDGGSPATGEGMPVAHPGGNFNFNDTPSTWSGGGQGSSPGTGDPVVLTDLSKSEDVLDLRVMLPGSDFVWSRGYSSAGSFDHANAMGYRWFGNAFYYLDTSHTYPIVMGQTREDVEFVGPVSYVYKPRGVVTQELRHLDDTNTQLTLSGYPGQGSALDVWTLREPGKWEIDFYKSGGSGLPAISGRMLQYRDAYGNTRTYEYTTLSNVSGDNVRLSKIYLNGTEDPDGTSDPSDAVIELTWFDDVAGPTHNGQLDRVEVVRDSVSGTVVTQWIDYDYATEIAEEIAPNNEYVSDDVALSTSFLPLLVQVKKGVLVDDVPASLSSAAGGDYHVRFTQYRYHDDTSGEDYPSDPEDANGPDGYLKAVITPEQIEYLAQRLNDDATGGGEPLGSLGSIGEAPYLAAAKLLISDDTTDIDSSGGTPLGLASKIISYNFSDSDSVSVQWLQASCGCAGGSTSSKRLVYSVIDTTDTPSGPGLSSMASGRTVRIEEYEGTTTNLYREYRYDMVYPRASNSPAYLVGKALYDHVESQGWWVWWYDHDFTSGSPGDTYDVYAPSAMSSYTPASSMAGASYSAVSSGGLIQRRAYNSDRRWTESLVGTMASGSASFTPVTRVTYPGSDSTSGRTYLPSTVERNRTGTAWGSATADQVETTTYTYNFVDSTTSALRRRGVSAEAELVAENGPGVQTYDSVAMYDAQGQLVWTVDAGGSMTYLGRDATTGAVTTLIRNADPDGTDSSNPAFVYGDYGYASDPGFTGTNGSGGDLETTTDVDLLGRWVRRTSPGGVATNARREVVADSERVGVAYLSSLILPHRLSGTLPAEFDGPAVRSWMDAAGKPTRTSEYAVDGTQTYAPYGGTYTLSTELARSTVVHDIHGQAVKSHRWHDIASNAYVEWDLVYDTYGRLVSVTDPEETITVLEYDAIDRLISVQRNVKFSGVADVTLARAYYDSVTTTQGVGNGNVNRIDYFTQEPGSGGLSAGTRTEYRTHDIRNRIVKIQNPTVPHYAYEYDNLSRLTQSAVFSSTPTDVDTPYADRGLLSVNYYSQRGLVYRRSIATDPSVSSPDYLQSDVWYDAKGRVIKNHPHSSPAEKYVYDGLDRVTTVYLTDARGDAKPGNSGNYASADDVTGDTVFEQTSYTYSNTDEDGLLDLVEHRVRNHDATAYGEIAAGDGVTSWIGYAYDDADRRTHTVDFGTTLSTFQTGGTDPTTGMSPVWPPSSPPSATSGTFSSDDYIVTGRTFNNRGLVDRSIDPEGDVTKYLYDDASRTIAVIEAYDDAALDSTPYASGRWQFVDLDDDEDRVTSYVYNDNDQVVRMVAHLPDGSGGDDAQVTEYTYGVTAPSSPALTDSLVYDNRLLRKIAFPNESTGDAGSGGTYEVSFSYNTFGELRSVTDQNSTQHVYERDTWGRVTADRIENFGTDIDNTVQRIEIGYDDFGRIETVESLDDEDAGMGSVVNGVTYEYTPLWQVSKMHQDTDGVASTNGTGGTETVEYAYDTEEFDSSAISIAAHNYTRLDDLVYPSDSAGSPTVTVRYGNSSSADTRASRANGFDFDGTAAVLYQHVGWGRVAEVDYAAPDVQLDRTFSHEGKRNTQGYSSQSAGVYPGWDRFGRVRVQAWVDGDLDELRSGQGSDPNENVPGIPPIIEELQTYDRASNRTGRIDARPGAKRPNRDYDLAYDGLDRLTSTKRGSWGDAYTQTTWTQAPTAVGNSEAWTYDVLGNWDELLTDGNFDDDFADTSGGASYVDLDETRTHNMANELSDIDEDQNVGGVDLSFLYDHAGNRTRKTYVSGVGYDTYIYDAWNRLVKIERTDEADPPVTTDVSAYTYNGLHFRITEASGDQTREMYYGMLWQLIEEHVDEPGETPDRELQHFWGKRYIDDAIMHRTREVTEETWAASDSFYHLTDPQYSTLAILDGTNALKESVYYSSYGVPTAYRPGDVNGDGAMSPTELSIYYAVSDISSVGTTIAYSVELDIDRDGEVNSDDITLWTAEYSMSSMGVGMLSDASVVDNRTGYAGYRWEPETLLWHVRFRAYDPYAGRWLQRDPAGYVDGASLYQYIQSAVASNLDPTGEKLWIKRSTNNPQKEKERQDTQLELEILCPGTKVNKDGSVTIPECEENEAPACKVLRALNDHPTTITIDVRQPGDKPYKPNYKWDSNGPKINWDRRYINPFSVRNPDGTLKEDRVPEGWETLWHELFHAYRHLQNIRKEGKDGEYGPAQEEFETIDGINKFREWYRKEYNISPEHFPDRDPFGHPAEDKWWEDIKRNHPHEWDNIPRGSQ